MENAAGALPARIASRPARHNALVVSLREHLPLIAAVATYSVSSLVLGAVTGNAYLRPFNAFTLAIGWRYLYVTLALTLVWHALHFGIRCVRSVWRRQPDSEASVAAAWRAYRLDHLQPERFLGLLISCSAVAVLISTFWGFKRSLPAFKPFAWDLALMEVDSALHLGAHPWELLHAVLGAPIITVILDRLYYSWFLLVTVMIAWQAWSRDRILRSQFFLTYAMCLILLGTFLAFAVSSAGPCYYSAVVGEPDPYRSLMSYLHRVNESHPLNALRVQEWLWSGYHGAGEFLGISAMPSLHVALPTLFALAGHQANRRLGALLTAYAILIFLGSVHLGWHYAVDGYVSVVSVFLLWKVVGYYVRRDQAYLARMEEQAE